MRGCTVDAVKSKKAPANLKIGTVLPAAPGHLSRKPSRYAECSKGDTSFGRHGLVVEAAKGCAEVAKGGFQTQSINLP